MQPIIYIKSFIFVTLLLILITCMFHLMLFALFSPHNLFLDEKRLMIIINEMNVTAEQPRSPLQTLSRTTWPPSFTEDTQQGFLLAPCFIPSAFSPFFYNSAQTNSSGCCQDAKFRFLGYLIGVQGGSVFQANTLRGLLLQRPLWFL